MPHICLGDAEAGYASREKAPGGELNVSGQGKMPLTIMHKVDSEKWSRGEDIRTMKRSGIFHRN